MDMDMDGLFRRLWFRVMYWVVAMIRVCVG